MGSRRSLIDWLKYERLANYPALAVFDRTEALKRLKAYEQEEYQTNARWLAIIWGVIALLFLVWIILGYLGRPWAGSGLVLLVLQLPICVCQYMMYRRIRRRIQAKVAAELRDGRVWTCVGCGYDLRATEGRCPECGADVHSPVNPARVEASST